MNENNINTLFSIQKQQDGPFRVIAKSGHLMTYLVCECESSELAMFLVSEFNQQHEEAKRKIISSISVDPDSQQEPADLLKMA